MEDFFVMEMDAVIESVRVVVIYLRDSAQISRSEISLDAEIKASDLDNFTRKKYGDQTAPQYKTIRPSEVFLKRLSAYILREQVNSLPKSFNADIDLIRRYVEQKYDKNHIDLMSEILFSMNIMDEVSIKKMNTSLQGGYYLYRPAVGRNNFTRSYIKIHKSDIYNKATRFSNWHKEESGHIKTTDGYVLEMDNKYFLVGFVRGLSSSKKYVGMKNIIVGHSSISDKQEEMNGLISSYTPNGSYISSRVLMKKTTDDLDEKKLGTFNAANHPDENLNLSTLIQNLSNHLDTINSTYTLEDPIVYQEF